MKKSILFILVLLVNLTIYSKDLNRDVTMVSYEQSWLDYEGTIALKNNTSEVIRNVSFVLTYLDMNDNELDYKEFNRIVTIEPGKTRKLDIEAYEHDRFYHYYKSKGDHDNPAFKIKYQLKDYNLDEDKVDNYSYDSSELSSALTPQDTSGVWWTLGIGFFAIIFAISVTVGLYVLVAVMAKKRHRNIALWILLSILATPLLMVIILLIIGDDTSNAEKTEKWV